MAAKGKAGETAKVQYDVLSPLQDGEYLYELGDSIELAEADAKPLIAIGVLKAPKVDTTEEI